MRLKVLEGREVHKKKALEPSYLRKKLGVTDLKKSVYLSDYETGICGIVDEILFLKDNLATLIDYKFAFNKRRFKTQFMQSVFYAILIEKNFKVIVPFSCIVYTRDKNELVTYEIKEKDKKKVLESIEDVHLIIESEFYPKGTTSKKKCLDCTYKNICIK